MAFELKDRDLLGRIGKLTTKSGEIETPAFMPVINPVNQMIPPKVMKKNFGCNILITNSYLIRKNLGELPDLQVHKLLDYDGVIATDSGAYQILVYGNIEVTQDEIIQYQKKIGSDIGVILDIPTGWDVPRSQVEWTVNETLRRAEEAIPLIADDKTLWIGPVQGGKHLDLVAKSAKSIGSMPFQIHALGSPTEVMERYMFTVLVDMIVVAKRNLPPDRPLHLFGAGHPMMFSLAVALGCDLFDSASYALYAKDNRYLTNQGTLKLENLLYLPCSCPVCMSHTAQELKDETRSMRERHLAEHNLYVCMSEITTIKQAIYDGSLWDLVERRSRAHPSMTSALKRLREYRDDLEKSSPSFKGHGVFYYDYHSVYRPEATRYMKQLYQNYSETNRKETLLLITEPFTKPFNWDAQFRKLRDFLSRELGDKFVNFQICFIAAPYGCIPLELSETYPLSQYDIAEPLDNETLSFTVDNILDYLSKNRYQRIIQLLGDGKLDNMTESVCMEDSIKWGSKFFSVWVKELWSEDTFKTLVATINM
ncbi:tRNA guanosine(15) transglycosylase TgtA [Candidatus Bathyarchaeota archaeon]|nr:tRNA guanosine(15) transglycosylase TgtA [Candidatus Bathyarchaeota archaeon]